MTRPPRPVTALALNLVLLAACAAEAPQPGAAVAEVRAATPPGADRVAPDPVPAPAELADGDRVVRAGGAAREAAAASPPPAPDAAASEEASPRAPEPRSQQDVVRLLRRTAGIYSGMKSLSAQFTMVTDNPLLRLQITSRGTLFQRRPDRILLRFSEPAGDLILGDGEFFWIYYPSIDAGQVIRTPAAGATGVVDLQAQFVGDPVTRFEHTYEGRETVGEREASAVTLVPREDLGYRKLRIWIDDRDSLVRRFEITDGSGIVRRLDLRELRVDPDLDPDLFRFVPPPGVRIVER